MGEVWKARDPRLGRDVAIKVLPAGYAADAQLRERFEREAKAIARLSHPHICTVYDVGDGYLVMELLEGEPLDERLSRGPLPVDEVLRYGAQIAEGLDRAHRAGIVHRDLKPGNVMITKSGAKLLDFGLAKSTRIPIRGDDATAVKALTQEGWIVGTFQYMAPEQVSGQEVDHRADIFAFGATLYEMTTAKPAFDGDSRVSVLAAIMTAKPPSVSELRPEVPPALEHVIAKCLSRDPEERWQSARDVAEDLRWIGEPRSGSGGAVTPRKRSRAWIALTLAVLAAAVALWFALRPRPRVEVVAAAIPMDGTMGLKFEWGPPSFSPDGKWLAYSSGDETGQPMIWLRSMDQDNVRPLAGTKGGSAPFWSPDGRFIGFTASGELKKISVSDGSIETLATKVNAGWTWNRDGVILYVGSLLDSLYRVPAAGGKAVEVVTAASIGASLVGWPSFLPDGNHFLFAVDAGRRPEQSGIWIGTLDRSETPRFLTRATAHVTFVEPGYIVYVREGVLRAQRFDPGQLRLLDGGVTLGRVAELRFGDLGEALFAASSSLLVWQPAGDIVRSELVLRHRNGAIVRKIGEAAFYSVPRISPDGRRIVVDRSDPRRSDSGDIWLIRIDDGTASRFSFDPRNETTPVWSPDGEEIAYGLQDTSPARTSILRKRADKLPRPIVELPGICDVTDWSRAGQNLAAARWHPGRRDRDVLVWSIAESRPVDVATSTAEEYGAVFSPDGRWIAYQSDESGRMEIYVQPFPPTGAKYQVSSDGGYAPRWAQDREIIWTDLDRRLMVAAVETAPLFRNGPPKTLFDIEPPNMNVYLYPAYDVLPDGDLIVNTRVRDQPQPLRLLVHWTRRFYP